MPDHTQKLTTKVEAEGAKQAADDLDKVAEAQRGIGEATKQAADQAKPAGTGDDDAKKIKDTAEATEDLNVEEQALRDVLNQIHPAFGGLLDMMRGATRLAGQLGTANLSLTGILEKAKAAILGNAQAFTTLLAGGAVVAGILAIVKAWQSAKEAMEAYYNAAKGYAESQTTLAERHEATRKELRETLIDQDAASEENLRKSVGMHERLRRAGYAGVGVPIAGAFAAQGVSASQEDLLAAAAAYKAGLLDPTKGDIREQLAAVRGLPSQAAEMASVRELVEGERKRFLARARQQLTTYDVERGSFGSKLTDSEEADAIYRLLEEEFGLTGQAAEERIHRMQQEHASRQAARRGESDPFGAWHDFFREDVSDVIAGDAGPVQTLDRIMHMTRPEDRGEGRTEVHHHHTTIQNHGRYYRSGRGIRGGKNGANWRERSGIG